MVDFSKKEAIRVLEKFDYEYLGFLDAGWGEKFYTFRAPNHSKDTMPIQYRLGEMRRRAYLLDMQDWHRMQRQSEEQNETE